MKIQFEAQDEKWVCIKKGEFNNTPAEKIDASRLCASISQSAKKQYYKQKDDEKIANKIGAKWNRRKKDYVLKGRKNTAKIQEWLETALKQEDPDYTAKKMIEMAGYKDIPEPKIFDNYINKLTLGTDGYQPKH